MSREKKFAGMANTLFQLQKELRPILQSGNLSHCESMLSARLAALPHSPFHDILDLAITNDPAHVAASFDEFFKQQSADFKVRAAYTEMNGFEINTDLWFCNIFAFVKYGGHTDYDWLSDWQSEDSDLIPIEGLESVQEVYASDAFRDERFSDACAVTGLLIVVKFQNLIRKAAQHMQALKFPLLATAHDYDFIYELRRESGKKTKKNGNPRPDRRS